MLDLLSRLPWRKPPLPRGRRLSLRNGCSPPDEPGTRGCGWFDSSHELVHGLVVREADDAALGALPLSVWLEIELQRRGPHALPA